MSREASPNARPHGLMLRARERAVYGEIERCCNKCENWYSLDKMRKDKHCHRGRSNECKLCFNDRKRIYRARKPWRVRDWALLDRRKCA